MGVYGDKAVKARARYEKLKTEVESKEADAATMNKLVELVTGLTHTFDNIERKIVKALEALGKVKELFLEQSKNYSNVSKKLGMASSNVPKRIYFRKGFIQQSINFAIEGLRLVCSSLPTSEDLACWNWLACYRSMSRQWSSSWLQSSTRNTEARRLKVYALPVISGYSDRAIAWMQAV